jgi:hypothetical protein
MDMPKSTTLPGEKIGTNLNMTVEGRILSLHIDMDAEPWTNPKSGKRLLSTSHGPARTHGMNVAVNVTTVGG